MNQTPSPVEFVPDWEKVWTAKEAEKQLDGFKFQGPGWYITGEDTMLVMPVFPTMRCGGIWATHWLVSQMFRFCVYNKRNPVAAFNAIVNAPVRVHTEDQE